MNVCNCGLSNRHLAVIQAHILESDTSEHFLVAAKEPPPPKKILIVGETKLDRLARELVKELYHGRTNHA